LTANSKLKIIHNINHQKINLILTKKKRKGMACSMQGRRKKLNIIFDSENLKEKTMRQVQMEGMY
jgi:hypothetical protein